MSLSRWEGVKVMTIAEKRKFKIKMEVTLKLFNLGIISKNEVRKLCGLEPISGGDELYINKNYIEIKGDAYGKRI